jgi:hypothetical protein
MQNLRAFDIEDKSDIEHAEHSTTLKLNKIFSTYVLSTLKINRTLTLNMHAEHSTYFRH